MVLYLGIFVGILVGFYLCYYIAFAVKIPQLYGAKGKFGAFLRENCQVIEEYYWPTFWCLHTSVMSIIPNILRNLSSDLNYFRESIITPDNGQISIDWYDPLFTGSLIAKPSSTPIAFLLPGLTGTSQTDYIRTIIPVAHKIGYRCVALNYRGLGGNKMLTDRFYCSVSDDDLKVALMYIKEQNPEAWILGVGFSMGGNIMTRYLRLSGESSLIDAALVVSCCFNFEKAALHLITGFWPQLMNLLLCKFIVASVMKHKNLYQHQFDLSSFSKFTSLRQFDETFLTKNFGFKNADEYYKEATNCWGLGDIQVPTLGLSAADDLINPESYLPKQQAAKSSHFQLLVTSRGGHIGFAEGIWPMRDKFWYLERIFKQYTGALFKLGENPRNVLCK